MNQKKIMTAVQILFREINVEINKAKFIIKNHTTHIF
jgi:hypothetical protein